MPKSKTGDSISSKPNLPAVLTKHQSYVYKELLRSDIKMAAYNPRKLSDQNRKMLKKSLLQKGLAEPIIVNTRTMTLIGGHQRLSILDDLEGSPNYMVGAACLDLTETEEKELNLALNSPNLQGFYDPESFFEILKTPHLDLDAIGFTSRDLLLEFADVPADVMALLEPTSSHSPSPLLNPELPNSVLDQMTDLEGDRRKGEGSKPKVGGKDYYEQGQNDTSASDLDRNSPEALKNRKEEYRVSDSSNPVHDTDYSLQILFNSQKDREAFLQHNNLRSLSRFITADEIIPLLSPAAKWRE